MSDLPAGVSDSIFYTRPNGETVELMTYRRQPDIKFVQKPKQRRKIPGSFRKEARPRLKERDGMLCHYCHSVMIDPPTEVPGRKIPGNVATIEHVVPQSQKGPNHLDNLVLACLKCNNDFGSTYIKCHCDFCVEARAQFGVI